MAAKKKAEGYVDLGIQAAFTEAWRLKAKVLAPDGEVVADFTRAPDSYLASDDAHELVLFAENDERSYRRLRDAFYPNALKRVRKQVYRHELAKKLFEHYADQVARAYVLEHGGNFPAKIRREVAAYFTQSFEVDVAMGEVSV